MSSTVAKALTLLDQFSEDEPELGLSELARRSKIDKASVHRMLSVMADAGLVEQRGDARLYRLGAGVLRLARVREKCFPVTSIIQTAIGDLAAETGETAHASLISGRSLATICTHESNRSSRVSLVAGEVLPFHSTASGLAALAFSSPAFGDRILSVPMEAKTDRTITDPATLLDRLEDVRRWGFSESDQTNEDDVYGIAVPVFDSDGLAVGAIAVATPAHRMTDELRARIIRVLLREGERVTAGTGGRTPASYKRVAARTLDEVSRDSS